MRDDLTFRADYFADPGAFDALVDLLRDIFSIDIGDQRRFGGPDPSSMPFGYFDAAGRLVANFSAFAMPIMVDNRQVRAVGFQSGAVRPEYRGQGLYRDLMRRAFAWADRQGFEAGILLSDKPALYEPHGFRTLSQWSFHGPAPRDDGNRNSRRDLSLDDRNEAMLLRQMLVSRQPVSRHFAVERQAEMFLLNACLDETIRLSLLPGCHSVIAWRLKDARHLQLLDVVSPGRLRRSRCPTAAR